MKNLNVLKKHGDSFKEEMNKISHDILSLEKELKKGCFPEFQFDIYQLELKIVWGTKDRRLYILPYDSQILKPLIETKIEIRKKIHPYLDVFISNLIDYATGIINPELKLLKG